MKDPLGAVEVTSRLLAQARAQGVETRISSDFHEFAALRQELRGKAVSPMFDPVAGCLSPERAFWMGSYLEGKCVATMAFRLDHVEPNLATWALGWMVGLYMRRGELIVPSHITPPGGTRAEKLSGPLVYQGEAWIDPKAMRTRWAVDTLPLLGTMLAYIKWQPNAFWAIGSGNMATRGVYVRMHYPTVERSFLRWEWLPDGADPVEWLGIAERADMEFNIQERLAAHEPAPAPVIQMRRMSAGASFESTETPALPSGKMAGSTTR